jgi:5'-nucleotidase
VRVLLTNDDGIEADGLQALRRALLGVEGLDLAVIAPDSNRSAIARGITTRRPLWVEEVDFGDGSVGYATDGTPVDCVRFAALGLVEGFEAELIVSGINHGSNLGDDITYSGTVAAALEGVVLGLPAVAVSQQSAAREMDFRLGERFDFEAAAAFTARVVAEIEDVPLPSGTLLNINVPAGKIGGVEVARLGKRIYRDQLSLEEEESGRKRYRIYGDAPDYHHEDGTDLAAIADGRIAVTPLHFDLTDEPGLETLGAYDLARLLAPAADEVDEVGR